MNNELYVTLPICSFSLKVKISSLRGYIATPTTLGENLRKVRLKRNLKQCEVAQQLGANSVSLSNWELNKKPPHPKFTKSIIDFLGYTPSLSTTFDHLGTRVNLYIIKNNINLKDFSERNNLPFTEIQRLLISHKTKLEIALIKEIKNVIQEPISSSS